MGLTRRIKVDNTTIEYPPDQSLRVKDLGITTAKIADQAVDVNKIARPSIIADHLFTRSVFQKHLGILVPFYGFMNMKSTQQLGLWLDVRYGFASTTTGTWPADTNIRFWPFILRNTVQVNAIRVNVSTAASAGNEMRFNIYDGNWEYYGTDPDDAYYYWPRTKLLTDDWIFDTTTTGIKSITLSPALTLDRGKMYWFAMQNNNVGTTKPVLTACASPQQYILGATTASFTTGSFALLLTGVAYGPLPNDISSSYPSITTSSLIAPSVQIQFNYLFS